jgi:hypothetical protein
MFVEVWVKWKKGRERWGEEGSMARLAFWSDKRKTEHTTKQTKIVSGSGLDWSTDLSSSNLRVLCVLE